MLCCNGDDSLDNLLLVHVDLSRGDGHAAEAISGIQQPVCMVLMWQPYASDLCRTVTPVIQVIGTHVVNHMSSIAGSACVVCGAAIVSGCSEHQ